MAQSPPQAQGLPGTDAHGTPVLVSIEATLVRTRRARRRRDALLPEWRKKMKVAEREYKAAGKIADPGARASTRAFWHAQLMQAREEMRLSTARRAA
jgi:hypothetical protein